MSPTCDRSQCGDCPGRIVCRCLQVTEEAVQDAIATFALTTLKQVREVTGAGDGCTCCHKRLSLLLAQAQSSSSAICSLR
jgi:bacterioferritin-associated ferredoxin